MKIGFFHVDTHTAESDLGFQCSRLMVKSARKQMPNVKIVHFTDLTTAEVKGVDIVRRKPSEPMALLRMRHHAGVQGEWLFVDTDVIFQKSVTDVFEREFDIAVTTRNWPHLKTAVGFTERMPFNSGVVFSRCPRFWSEVYLGLKNLDAELQQWMGDQEVICSMVYDDACRYQIEKLKGSAYNFPPRVGEIDDGSAAEAAASILHYKGPSRKPLLLKRMKEAKKKCA